MKANFVLNLDGERLRCRKSRSPSNIHLGMLPIWKFQSRGSDNQKFSTFFVQLYVSVESPEEEKDFMGVIFAFWWIVDYTLVYLFKFFGRK